jgi:uncharacterized protein YbcV (DUF1398 family)
MRQSCSILRIGPNADDSVAQHLQLSIVQHLQQGNQNASTDEDKGNYETRSKSVTISNKYFTAYISLEGTCEQSTNNPSCTESILSEDGIILVFNDNDNTNSNNIGNAGTYVSFDSLQEIHEQLEQNNMAGDLLRLCVGVHFGTKRTYPSEKDEQQEYSRRILWCLDRGYEYVEADISTEGVNTGHDVREKDGFPRIIEAISGTVWSSAVMTTSKVSELKQSYEHDKNDTTLNNTKLIETEHQQHTSAITPLDPNNVSIIDTSDNSINDTTIPDTNFISTQNLVNETYLDEIGKQIDVETLRHREMHIEEEKQVESMEGAIREAKQIRELSLSGTLSDTERRKRAGDAAVLLLNLMGLDGEEESDNDSVE